MKLKETLSLYCKATVAICFILASPVIGGILFTYGTTKFFYRLFIRPLGR
jgi:hypothetical protein